MGLFGLKLPKKANDIFGAIGRGASRTFDQVNPFDNNRTWQQTTPTQTKSTFQQTGQLGGQIARGTLGGTARVLNTIAAQVPQVYYTAGAYLPWTNDQERGNLIKMQNAANENFQRGRGGLLNAGTLYGSDEAKRGDLKTGITRIGGGTLESGLELSSLGLGGFSGKQLLGQGLKGGVKPQLPILGKNYLLNTAQGGVAAANQGANWGDIAKSAAISGPLGTATDVGLGLGYAGLVKGGRNLTGRTTPLNEQGFIQVGRTPKKIHPDDQAIMADFVDHARGAYKPDPKTAQALELDAARIAERYGFKMPPTTKGLANEFAKRLDQEGFGTKKGITPLNEEGFIRLPGRKEKAPKTVEAKGGGLKTEVKRAISDQDQVILDQLKEIDKKRPRGNGEMSRVDEFMYNSNMQRGSNQIANQVLSTSENLKSAIGGMSKRDYKGFSEYANARTELASATKKAKAVKGEVRVSRPTAELRAIVKAGQERYGSRFEALNQHYKELAKVARDAGIIDEKTFKRYTKNNDYIRLQRDMGELLPNPYGRGNSYQLGSTTMKQRRKGSTRAALDAGEVTAERTQQIYREAAKNRTGTQLVDTLSEHGLAEKVSAKKAVNQNTVSVFRNGKKEFYKVLPEMKTAMDNINPYHMNIVMRVLAAPGRTLRAGVTGLNPVFIARNLVKDQFGSAINSKNMLATHNPKTFFQGLFNATADATGFSKNPIYQDFLKHYGDQTSFDLTRNIKETKAVVSRIRGGKKQGALQAVTHPVRSLENLASITEKSTRFQNYVGEFRKGIKEGLTKDEASQRAAIAAWQNSVDFSRAGTWGRVINTVIPYWNPATQGVRQMGRTLADHPVKSVFAGTTLVGMPLVTSTAWNLSNPDTREIWNNIPEYEKDNNIILIPPGTKQNEDGSYDVIKVPLPPGYKDVFMPLRRAFDSFAQDKPQDGVAMAQDLLQAVSGPIGTKTKEQFVGSFIPQAAKPGVQQGMNKDLFTGKEIVPGYINEATDAQGNPIPESKKAYKQGSGTAQAIGNALNVSPIRVEKFIKDTTGTVGLNLLNASDNLFTPDRVGGQSVAGGFKRSFASTQGIVNENRSEGAKYYDKVKEVQKTLNSNEVAAWNSLHPNKKNFLGEQIYEHDAVYDPVARLDIYNRFPKVYEADKQLDQKNRQEGKPGNPLFDLQQWQLKKVLEKENLPPGSKDPELSNLYKQEWYQSYRNEKTDFFNQLKETAKKEGKPFGSQNNPYPETPPNLQRAMDYYSSLPSGTGARSSWIKANPATWAAMQRQFALVDNWQNIQRGKRGLDMTEGDIGKAAGYGSSSGGYGRGKARVFNAADYYKKYDTGGSSIPSGQSKLSGKAKVAVKKRGSTGKVRVKSSKLRLA